MTHDPHGTPLSEPAPPAEPRFAFDGSGWHVFPMHLVRLLAVGGIALTLPFGLGAGLLLEVRAFVAPLGLGGAWGLVEQAIATLPLVSSGVVALLLVVVWGMVKTWMDRYRVEHTRFDGEPLTASAGCNPLPAWLAVAVIVATLGLASPWVMTWRKRRQYAGWKTRHGPLAFRGSALGIAWYGALSLVAMPFAVLTLGLAWIPLRFLWLRWEQGNLAVPVAANDLRPLVFEATLWGYLRQSGWRWLCTLLTLGLYQPWAWIGAWAWTWAHTRPVAAASDGETTTPPEVA